MKWPSLKLPQWKLSYAQDATLIVGLGSIVYGVARMHEPSAFILAGLMLVAIAFLYFPPAR